MKEYGAYNLHGGCPLCGETRYNFYVRLETRWLFPKDGQYQFLAIRCPECYGEFYTKTKEASKKGDT